jgi:DNA-binding XRE family transcriptional regulator
MSKFAKQLRRIREREGVSYYRLSKITGISRQGVINLERDGSDPKLSTVEKVTKGLGVPLGELIGLPHPPTKPKAALPRLGKSVSLPRVSKRAKQREGTDVMAAWTQSELARRKQVEAGETVVANIRTDTQLIAWAKKEGLYVRIARPGPWGNPYIIGEDGDRPTCIASFRTYFIQSAELCERLDDLKGKVLGCYCHPEPCHGHELIQFLRERPGRDEQADT